MSDPPALSMLERAPFEAAGVLRVQAESDRFAAAALARAAAKRLGLSSRACEAVQIAACELAGNLVRHAGGGSVELGVSAEASVVRLCASDRGPPIHDVEMAFADGSTDRGPILPEEVFRRRGIGAGLGALRRLALVLVIAQSRQGKVITAYLGQEVRPEGVGCPVVVRAGRDDSAEG
ncbi:MAG TPA: ATP-binding protein [Myxococcales bacterium]